MIGVAFDLSGTLVRGAGLERAAFLELLRRLSAEHGPAFDDARAAEACAQAFTAEDERGPAQTALVEAANAFLGETAPARVLLSRFRQVAVQRIPNGAEPLPEARETLAHIASLGIPCAILTNGWSSLEQHKARGLGFTGPVLVSEDTGRRKPECAAFESLAAVLALPLDRIWFVGDDPYEDVTGAAQAGLHAIWLRPPGAPLPAGAAEPEHAIERIGEILSLLSEPYTRSLLGLRYLLHSTLAWRQGHFIPGIEYGLNDPASLTHVMPARSDDG
ncbi:MAG: HAD family hydrolase [Vulcanimicrobiaceae bacterium]